MFLFRAKTFMNSTYLKAVHWPFNIDIFRKKEQEFFSKVALIHRT